MRVLDCHEQCPDDEKHLCGQDQPGHRDKTVWVGCLGKRQPDDRFCQHPHQPGQNDDASGDEPEHRCEGPIGADEVAGFDVPAQNRDQGDGQICAGQQVAEKIGDRESLLIEIGLGADSDQCGQ